MDVKQFGKRIIFRREELDLSQKQLADIIHISNIHLSNIEHGKALPSFSTFLDLCAALNVSVSADYLIAGNVYPELSVELSEKIKRCSDENKIIISKIVDVFLE